MRYIVSTVLILFLNLLHAQPENKVVWEKNLIDSLITLEPLLKSYPQKSSCEKVEFLDSLVHQCKENVCINKGSLLIIKDLERITNHFARFSGGEGRFIHSFYNNYEDFEADIIDWKKVLKCSLKK